MSALASRPDPAVTGVSPSNVGSAGAPGAPSGAVGSEDFAPRRLGKYELVTRLGSGGMGDVYLAAMHGPNHFRKLCVVKQLRLTVAQSPRTRDIFSKEAYLSARLNHPHIVQTYETGEEDGVPFISMEYLEGQTMRGFLAVSRETQLLPDFMLWARVVADALAGLHHAHELRDFDGSPLGLIHRDVSPHNIFVTYEGRVCLIDFGAAKLTLRAAKVECRTLTGKLGYMAPEYVTGGQIDRRADVFSMGVVLWEALSGKKMPNAGLAPSECCLARPRVSTVQRRVPAELDAIVAKALEVDPSRRYPTALAMREALEAYLETEKHAPREEDIGALMSAYFEDDRAKLETAIRAKVETLPRAFSNGVPSDACLDQYLDDEPQDASGVRRTPADGEPCEQTPFDLAKRKPTNDDTVNFAVRRKKSTLPWKVVGALALVALAAAAEVGLALLGR